MTNNLIDINQYLKSTEETKIVSIHDNLNEYLKTKPKKSTTLEEVQRDNKWEEPKGVKPDRTYTLQDIIDRVEKNPGIPFSASTVWVPTKTVHIFPKFNRKPNIQNCITNLNFRKGLDYEAFGTPDYYLCWYKDSWILISTVGGHRATLGVLSDGWDAEIPCKITYIGVADIESIHERCALTHHVDCNKRVNQSADDRITSGVEAKDPKYVTAMQHLLLCNLYHDKSKFKEEQIKGFREITSAMNFENSVKEYELKNVKRATEIIMRNIPEKNKSQKILSQAVETIACVLYNFGEIMSKVSDGDSFDYFINAYLKMHNQEDLRKDSKVERNANKLITEYNNFVKREGLVGKAPIGIAAISKAFPSLQLS